MRAAVALEVGTAPVGDVRPVTDDDALWAAIDRHRLVEVLAPHADRLGLSPSVGERLRAARASMRQQTAVQLLQLSRLAGALDDAGLRWMLVKGVALATVTTGDPAGRGPGDLDLFVARESIADADAVLGALGWSPQVPLLEPGSWARRYVESTYHEYTYDGASTRVDLHWRLDVTLDALADFEDSWSRRVGLELAGRTVHTSGLVDTFRHISHHAAKDHWSSLRQLVDLHRLARQDGLWAGGYVPEGLDAASLGVVAEHLGLPEEVPAAVREHVATRVEGRATREARQAQDAQVRTVVAPVRAPGVQGLRYARYRLRASRTWADTWRSVVTTLLPATSVVDAGNGPVWVVVPRVIVLRAVHAVTWAFRHGGDVARRSRA